MSDFFLKLPTEQDCPYHGFKLIIVIMNTVCTLPNRVVRSREKNAGCTVKFQFNI